MLKRLTIIQKNSIFIGLLLFVLLMALLVEGILLTRNMAYAITVDRSIAIASSQAHYMSVDLIDAAKADTDLNSDVQRAFTSQFDVTVNSSDAIAFSYLFDPKIEENHSVKVIAACTDLSKAGAPAGGHFALAVEYEHALKELMVTKKPTATSPYTDPAYGDLITVLIPIKNENGDIVAVFGLDTFISEFNSFIEKFVIFAGSTVIVGIAIAIFVNIVFLKKFFSPIAELTNAFQKMGHGDLTINFEMKREDEFGKLEQGLSSNIADLKGIISNTRNSSLDVTKAATKVNNGVATLSSHFEKVQSSIDRISNSSNQQKNAASETARAMEELAAGVDRVASASTKVADLSRDMDDQSHHGLQIMENVRSQMNAIRESFTKITRSIDSVHEKSEDINEILAVIGEIAERTNLLALNASIEAARAGEQGRGFAVVAQEVGRLAGESETSAHRISEILNELKTEVSELLKTVKSGDAEVESGTSIVKTADESFNEIAKSASIISNEIQDVSSSSEEMSAVSEQVSAQSLELSRLSDENQVAIGDMSKIMKDSSYTITEFGNITDSLQSTMQEVLKELQRFKL
ncbi:MAG: methyl-accepting chemotaxis protein [Leptonema sp. (in: Bacteria)]|nr:methyl-accepting chemotaxis protein [Leptonema sp. (in: bacteria)]